MSSTIDPSSTDLPAVSYIRVASADPDDAVSAVERQRAQIALAAQRLGLWLADEFVDAGCSGMSMDCDGMSSIDHERLMAETRRAGAA
jgi:hypothetical protein